MSSAWATCGGFLTSATKMEGVRIYDDLLLLPKICGIGMHCCILHKFRCIPGAISGICGDLRCAPIPAGDKYRPVQPAGRHHLLEEAMPAGRR